MSTRRTILLSLVLGIPALLLLVYLLLPKGPRDPMEFHDPTREARELVVARDYAVVTGSPWATEAATAVLEDGGSAADAAVAALLMLNVTNGEAASFPGIAPTLFYDAAAERVRSYIGAGTAPEAASLERFLAEGHETVPDLHIWSQLLPASPDVMASLLSAYGRRPFAELAEPAIRRAREGFPVSETMAENLDFSFIERVGLSVILPYNAEVYLDGQWWRPLHQGSRFRRPDLAESFEALAEADRRARESGDYAAGVRAVRDYFYEGPLAEAILEVHREQDGLFRNTDLANYEGGWEEPISADFGRYSFHTNGTWSQGMTALMALRYLQAAEEAEGSRLEALGYNSEAYIHRVVQALDLAFADRDGYLADPAFEDVPVETLLSRDYARERQEELRDTAFPVLPAPGSIAGYQPYNVGATTVAREDEALPSGDDTGRGRLASSLKDMVAGQDTSQLVIVDGEGNAVAITPSDFPKSPMIPETGMTLGNRMVQFRLTEASPNVLAPGKRPRITPHAIMVHRDGEPWLIFNTPGGDMQAQALLQVFLNLTRFDMDLQEAVSAPRFRAASVPSSFAPHPAKPGTIELEAELAPRRGALEERGYAVEEYPRWDNHFGSVGAIITGEDGEGERILYAAADPREHTWAAGR